MDAAEEMPVEGLMQFLYQLPVAALLFRGDCTIQLLTPMAPQLLLSLLSLLATPRFENIDEVLGGPCPALRAAVAGFAPLRGTVIE